MSAAEIRERVLMPEAIEAVREVLRDVAAGHFTLPPRLHFDNGRLLVMAAYHHPTAAAAVKTLSVEIDRVPAIQGTVVWTDPAGRWVADAAAITTIRTGAIVGVATDVLARPRASVLALLGAGSQAPDQIRAVHAVRPLTALTVFDLDAARSESLVEAIAAELPGVRVRTTRHVADALADAEIVCCATSSSTPLFPLEALPPRVHVNAIGSFRPTMRELPDELFATADLVVVEQLRAALDEAGEIIHALGNGSRTTSEIYELAPLLSACPPITGRTVFKTVGIAAQDWAIARLLARRTTANPQA
ncbi:ornithine cyclodeaminase family protein [Embleya sp. NBC_00888]|uniref:ornithine cyclodeaminase family protein n=1 Tax=Embleya sp. NBC_00888 TaxID=2975960 RepID=UPI0038658598|nr:ornithine cyclodeaminase family protein [Embleya sp. NBC_00888]